MSLVIKSSIHDYSVIECQDLAEAVRRMTDGRNVFALVDKTLLDLHHRSAFEDLPDDRIIPLVATESQKSLESVTWIFTRLLEGGFRRDCELLAVGGGVIQDTVCFVASVLGRGARWSFIPTTLLAQCDSCIGGKSSINIGRFKNQIGNFYPPHEIALATDVLSTLPWNEIHSARPMSRPSGNCFPPTRPIPPRFAKSSGVPCTSSSGISKSMSLIKASVTSLITATPSATPTSR